MYKCISVLFICFVFSTTTKAQTKVDTAGVALQKLALSIQTDTVIANRFKSDSIFTRALIQTLKQPYSYNFHYDSLTAIKILFAPDNAFKIFSWQLDLGDGTYRQRAAMQLPTIDGALKLLPFFDNSDFIENPSRELTSRKNWIGAIYYQIVLTEFNNKKYYTLIGYDEYNLAVSRKIIEVMHFENNEPILGGDYFRYPPDETYPLAPIDRFIYAYKKGSNAFIRYEPSSKRIVLSELTSTEKDLKVASTLVPSGNELFFEWKQGKWIMAPKLAHKK